LNKLVIGLVGYKGAGKSTFASFVKSIVSDAEEIRIADKIKLTCAQLLNVDVSKFEDLNFKETPFDHPHKLSITDIKYLLEAYDVPDYLHNKIISRHRGVLLETPRKFIVYLATNILRDEIDQDIHLIELNKRIENSKSNTLIISDIRFVNEFEFLAESFGLNFKGIYLKNVKAYSNMIKNGEIEKSESFVPELGRRCQLKINNNSTIESFKKRSKSALEPLIAL
jgi:energy-coupling factor transporter ATP-binding protein EcfA2